MDERGYQIFVIFTVVSMALLCTYPLIYVISTSLVTVEEFNSKQGLVLWPLKPTINAYIRVYQETFFVSGLKVSIFRTVVGTILTLSMTTIVAYVASRVKMPGRNFLVAFVLVTILFNGGMIPTFLVARELSLLDSIWSLIVPTLVDGFSVLVLKQFFENVPAEIGESATIDGASEIQLMLKVLVPMSAPALAAIGLFTAVYHWNAWFDAFIYIRDPHKLPLQMIIKGLLAKGDVGLGSVLQVKQVSALSIKMAGVTMATLPILCVYPFLQKYFMKGMFMGAVKG